MKTLKIINGIILITTALLYLSLYYGLLFQILLGVLQLVSSVIIGFQLKQVDSKTQKRLKWYWVMVSFYALGLTLPWNNLMNHSSSFIPILGIILIPMSIALYFFIVLVKLQKL